MTRKERHERNIRRTKIAFIAGLVLVALLSLSLWLNKYGVAVLQPRGVVASQERSLMGLAVLLGMVVILPVYAITVFIVWKYRVSQKHNKKYQPDWDHSRWLETVWWAIPLVIITILSVITWRSSYALDPFKPLASNTRPLTVQVIALDWKWLFLYPKQHVASVNQLRIPVGTPVDLQITSDTVMNSFWVPQLAGQIYAMPGMSTQLHLSAGQAGTYEGSSANISGSGFAGMAFTTKAESSSSFNQWVESTSGKPVLNLASYEKLARPSRNNPVAYYRLPSSNLYNYVVMKYMEPSK